MADAPILSREFLEAQRAQGVSDTLIADHIAAQRNAPPAFRAQLSRLKADTRNDPRAITGFLNWRVYGDAKYEPPEQPGLLGRIGEDVKKRSANVGASVERFREGEQGLGSTALQVAGEAAGLAFGDVPGEALAAGAKGADALLTAGANLQEGMEGPLRAVLPDAAEALIPPTYNDFKKAASAVLASPAAQRGFEALASGVEQYEAWKAENTVEAENLESLVNIALALPVGRMAQAGGRAALRGGRAALKTAADVRLPAASLEQAKMALLKKNAQWANVPAETIENAYRNPDAMERAIKHVAANENPYTEMANDVGKKLLNFERDALNDFRMAKEAFKATDPSARFDVSQEVGLMYRILKDSHNIGVKVRDLGNKGIGVELVQGPAKKFTPKEMAGIEELVNTIANAKNYTADDLLDLEKAFDKAYNAVRLTELKTPKEYHAVVMKLKEAFDKAMRGGGVRPGILPDRMKLAYLRVSQAKQLLRDFGGGLLQGEGGARKVSDNAESFIKSLANVNRGVRRQRFAALERALGVKIADMVDLIEDAKILSKIEAATAGRQGDIVKSLLVPTVGGFIGAVAGAPFGGVGAGAGAVIGANAGQAAGMLLNKELTSPFKAGQRAIKLGKEALKNAPKPQP